MQCYSQILSSSSISPQHNFTSHSPFIAQEATDAGLFVPVVTRNGAVKIEKPIRSVRGWTAGQIFTSPLFGLESTRAAETESLIEEEARLTAMEHAGTLRPAEKDHAVAIKKKLSSLLSAPGETYQEMMRQKAMAKYVDQTLTSIKKKKKR